MSEFNSPLLTPEYLRTLGLGPNFPERFWAKVRITDCCWIFEGHINEDGYGLIGAILIAKGTMRLIGAHKASYLMRYGIIPRGMVVRHKCPCGPTPACVRPDHLCLGTPKQNSNDAAQLLRDAGLPHWNSRLNNDQITAIRTLCAQGIPNVDVAKMFGISPTHVSNIKRYNRLQNAAIELADGSGWQI